MNNIFTHKLGMGLAGLLLTMGLTGPVQAATIQVDDFTTITNAVFFDIGGTAGTGAMFGGVTITGNPAVGGASVTGLTGIPTPADPGDNRGWVADPPGVTLSFDTPVAAFGVSFIMRSNLSPTSLEAFSGLNGTGNSLGMVSPIFPVGSDTIDFVGLWSDALDIQSVVLSSSGFIISDGYGLSLTPNSSNPIPEPSTMILLGTGLAGIIAWRRKNVA